MIHLRILIVEDEYSLADIIASRLRKERYSVDISNNGEEGLDYALTDIYNLIILDIMLPKLNGFEILKEIRNKNIDTKVIMLTAKSQLEDKLNGFEIGADDYLTKPFHLEELVARVNVQLRKKDVKENKNYIEFGDLKLNMKNFNLQCTKTGESICISYKEYLILEYLMLNKSQIISKEQIYDKIWGIDKELESNNLEAYLSFIRKLCSTL